MKKYVFILVLAAFSSNVGAQDQMSMFSKVTATWCPLCGDWGWTLFEEGLEAMEDKNVLSMTLHYSGELQNQTAKDLADNLNANGQPRFYLNDDYLSFSSSSIPEDVMELEESVDFLNSFPPFASVSTSAVYNGYNIEVASEFEFLETIPGNYFIVSYLIKDHIIAPQSNQGSMADHRYVLMDSFGDETFGVSIASPEAESGLTSAFVEMYDIEIAEEDVSDYYVATVIWNFLETTQTYRFFNASVSQVSFLPSSTIDETLFNDYKVHVDNHTLNINTDKSDYQISVLNMEGKLITSKVCNGSTQINLSDLNSQMLIINITEGERHSSKRIFLK